MLRGACRTEPRVVRGIDDVGGTRNEPGAEPRKGRLEAYRHACFTAGQGHGWYCRPRRKGVAARSISGKAQCLEQGLERHVFPERNKDALVVKTVDPPPRPAQVDAIVISPGAAPTDRQTEG